jgi:hypothetical protein
MDRVKALFLHNHTGFIFSVLSSIVSSGVAFDKNPSLKKKGQEISLLETHELVYYCIRMPFRTGAIHDLSPVHGIL